MSSNKKTGWFKWFGTMEYMLMYVVVMILVVSLLFLFFPPIKELMHGWFPTDYVRYTAIFIIILLLPVLTIMGILSRGGALGMFILFDFPTKKYSKADIARFYFIFGLIVLGTLLLAAFFIFGGTI